MRQITHFLAALALASSSLAAGAAPPSVPAADAPALAALGPHAVGATTISVRTGAETESRSLRIVLWYPAARQTGASPMPYRHRLEPPPPLTALEVSTEALAVRDAAPAKGKFPLVIVSHGYRGWPESMSYITENLASKGYVVAGIDHGDRPFTDAAGFGASFALTASTRARDQQAVLAHLAGLPAGHKLRGAIDTDRVALIGYSMGGFGALATAGAGYDTNSPAYRSLPAGALADQAEGRREPDRRVRAVVAIAPWGAQPPHRAWSAASMKRLRAPLMVIAGDQDDISGYAEGIRWVFDHATGSDRRLLLYRNARHNVGGNPLPDEARGVFQYREMFEEPVWRGDRLNAINQHFITAFLNRHLKNDAAAAAFLEPPAEASAGWPGFQKRWALGFELQAKPAQ
ncbi:MAG TPA: dienelactone hydrolase family protein [Allosphingosinicella sp.]|nr:dienelactone hydrolase family protein [Allosphingosinicella sp.]